jgi:hypothetical protein
MNKKELDAQYQEHAQFNLTKLIRRNYEVGTPLPKEYFDGLDFLEESSKVLMLPLNGAYGRQHRYDVKQTLAENIVSLLPFEYYKEYIQPNWIVSNNFNNNGIIRTALDEQKYDFLYEILSQCKEYSKEHFDMNKREDNKFISSYESSLFNHILDLDNNLSQLKNLKLPQESYDNYFKLFKTTLSDFKEYYNKKYEILFNAPVMDHLQFDDEYWFLDFNKMESIFKKYNKRDAILEILATDSKAFDFFKDVVTQYKYAEENPFLEQNLIENAFKYGNKKVINYLMKNKLINSKNLTQAFETVLQEWVNNEEAKTNDRYDNKLGDNSVYLKNLLDLLQKNAPEHEIENYGLFSHILPASDQKLFDDVIEKYPKLKTEKLKDGLTLNQWHYAKQLFNDFIKDNNFNLVKSNVGCNYTSFDLFYMDKITEHYTDAKEVNLDEKIAIDEIIVIKFLPLLNTELNGKEITTIFYNYTLNKQMPENKTEGKKLKV